MWKVIGHPRAVTLLRRSLETDSLAHGYLFAGPAHVGKMTLAMNLAQALNCGETERPCGQCAACQRVASGKHADVQIIGLIPDSSEAKSRMEISIDQIREMQRAASLPPFEGKYKTFVIDGAELMSIEAANCLLKTLEEPADRVEIILLTTNERLLPATVISRCQRVELRPLALSEVESALSGNWGVEPEKATLLARLSHGCLGWAVAAALDSGILQQRSEHLDTLLEMIDGGLEERFAYAARLAAQFSQNRGLVREKLDLWLDWWRDLLLVKTGVSDAVTNVDRLATLIDMGAGYGLVQTKEYINDIRAAGDQLRQNANPRLVFEMLVLNIPEAARHGERRPAAPGLR